MADLPAGYRKRKARLVYGESNPSKTRAMAMRKRISATLQRALSRGSAAEQPDRIGPEAAP